MNWIVLMIFGMAMAVTSLIYPRDDSSFAAGGCVLIAMSLAVMVDRIGGMFVSTDDEEDRI